jgi:tetratricopeptide (TPR) repeat protein
MAFGELDFGGDDGGGAQASAIGVDEQAAPQRTVSSAPPVQAAATAPVSLPPPGATPRLRTSAPPQKKRSLGKTVAGVVGVLAVLGGAGLQLTPYGAYGYLVVGDMVHAKDYAATTASTIAATEKTLGSGTYDDAKNAIESAAGLHARQPRIKPLGAYAAIVDSATTVRFGNDPGRAPRSKQLVGELAQEKEVAYLDVAQAALQAEGGDASKARAALDAASKRYPGDPVLAEIALLRGEIELAAKDSAAAVTAFKQALAIAPDARAHFGLARGYDGLGDATNCAKEIDATLVVTPLHPGALTLRARRKSAVVDETAALKDLATVLDGAAKAKASPMELSAAYAARAWVNLERGSASEARDAFGQAVKLDPRNVAALNGEGRLLLNEGRYTEALARFDTALQFDPASPESIANDAEAKLALERLADAKQQLTDARQRFPKSIGILLLLGKVEQRLNNFDPAEQDLRAAIALADPARPDAVLPFVALSELLSARGHLSDAKAVLDDARKRLPPSGALDRAVGEVDEAQGDYDGAIAQYRTAITKDPRDVATHFRLAVVLRRVRKFDDAQAELDRVAAVDKDYPGMSLERGLLFEESGDVDKAIEQFKAALAKAPDDPDLQLRVGSAYVAIGRPDDALPMLRKVLDKRATSAEAHHYIGRALMLRGPGDQAEALRFLKRAVDLDPNRAEFHVYLAWAANDAQPAQLDLARDEIDKALALDRLNAEAYWQRGILERIQGAIDDAIKDERRALELRPSRYEAHATLAECYDQKNDSATSLAEWARAVAGDGPAASDGTVAHPLWRYEYGKQLMDHGGAGAALAQLLPAAVTAEKITGTRPGWLAPLEFLTAEALRRSGRNKDAVEHYRRFLEIAPVNSPDRADAQRYLSQLAPQQQ